MMKNRKKTTVVGLSAFAFILLAALIMMLQPTKEPNVTNDSNDTQVLADNVIPKEIEDTTSSVTVEEVKSNIIIPSEPTTKTKVNDIQLTKTVEKAEPPEKPESDANQDLTDPNNKPEDVIVEPVTREKETQKSDNLSDKKEDKKENIKEENSKEDKKENTKKEATPKTTQHPTIATSKENNKNYSKGDKIYVDGFGWIEYSGPNEGKESGSDGDWEKQIGSMN